MARFLPTFKIISKYQLSKHRKRIKRRNFKFFAMKMIVHALKKKGKQSSSIVFLFDCFETLAGAYLLLEGL